MSSELIEQITFHPDRQTIKLHSGQERTYVNCVQRCGGRYVAVICIGFVLVIVLAILAGMGDVQTVRAELSSEFRVLVVSMRH